MRSDWWKFDGCMASGTRPPVRYIRWGEEGVGASDLGPSENQAKGKVSTRSFEGSIDVGLPTPSQTCLSFISVLSGTLGFYLFVLYCNIP